MQFGLQLLFGYPRHGRYDTKYLTTTRSNRCRFLPLGHLDLNYTVDHYTGLYHFSNSSVLFFTGAQTVNGTSGYLNLYDGIVDLQPLINDTQNAGVLQAWATSDVTHHLLLTDILTNTIAYVGMNTTDPNVFHATINSHAVLKWVLQS